MTDQSPPIKLSRRHWRALSFALDEGIEAMRRAAEVNRRLGADNEAFFEGKENTLEWIREMLLTGKAVALEDELLR